MKWIMPANIRDKYDAFGAFSKFGFIDWRQKNNFSIGDIVFIYISKPVQQIMFQTKVISVEMRFEDTVDDLKFWVSKKDYEASKKNNGYVRLQLISYANSNRLSFKNLLEHGLQGSIQSAIRCIEDKEHLGAYISSCFEEETLGNGYDEFDINEIHYEGSVTTVKVNKYERNQDARRKCIEIHGFQCKICGFDFEKTYGEVGKGLIHVHHVVPISTIKHEYHIDYEKDLIPVCPNCHAMIHRRKEPYSINEVREMLSKL